MVTINVGLDGWILSDGNYDDFRAGQETKFALEFYGPGLTQVGTSPGGPSLDHEMGSGYLARGQVVYSAPEVWVCDFGVLAYREEQPPDWAHFGAHAAGSIYLGVDPFIYFERLHNLPGMPKLTYRVLIRQVLLETTPWIPDPKGRFAAIRDESRTGFRMVEHTGVHDNSGFGSHFVLDCDILESEVDPVT